MKFIKIRPFPSLIPVALSALAMLLAVETQASPYASGVTNDNGIIRFVLNEDGGTVEVVFENNTTNSLGVLNKGAQSFALGGHTSFSIYVSKVGTGTPSLISIETNQFSVWNSPRGVDVNKNPKLGHLFGRTYVGNSAVGGTVPNNKAIGLYALNADQTEALGNGTNPVATATFAGSGGNGPWRLRIAPDNTVLVCDFSTVAAALWQFQPDLSNSNLVLSIIGQTAAASAGIHGDFFGTPLMTGSLAEGNLVLWTADSGMGVPNETIAPSLVLGPGTSRGSFNCLFRYDIGSGPLPWNNPPNYAYTLGLDSIAELRTEMDLGKDGKIIGGFGRANLSNGNIQILDTTGTTKLYDSLHGTVDPWNGINGAGAQVGTYAGVRVSPDGRFLASVDIQNGITLATMTNGIPDEGSIFGIANPPTTGNSRGMCWDAANNIYVISSGQARLRVYSLGVTSTCVTSNDFTGTNGSFQLILPSHEANIAATTPLASQNYVNNLTPGTPIPGVFTITLNTNQLPGPVAVNFVRSGTAVLSNHYNFNYGADANGVVVSSNSITFPAGTYPGVGNWSANLRVIPTTNPVSGPTLTVGVRLLGGANYVAGTPPSATVAIQNTGPQLLLLSPSAIGTTMYRGVNNDYARFIITRLGDTNGPGNSPGNINPTSYTITNFTYSGTAAYPSDYTARAQRIDPAGNGVIQLPTDGEPGIFINPGDVALTNVIGNPVFHPNLAAPPVNVTVVLSLTNATTGTNGTTLQGQPYSVSNNAVTLTELDNTIGPETVFFSDALTNEFSSTNWTLVFASTNFGPNTVLPVVVPNYTNGATSISGGGTNDFRVTFGHSINADLIPPSPAMVANGWDTVLKMTVNKTGGGAQSAVNLYPQGQNFGGNYALRFSMYLSIYSFGIDNPNPGTFPREFALFGVNHFGTNCNWRPSAPIPVGSGNSTTNADGIWFAIDAGTGSTTPADYDAFRSPGLPNAGVPADLVSATANSQSGVFKKPPFQGTTATGGQPINKWVDVSVEVSRQTNVSLFINRSPVLASFALTNNPISATYTNGTIMLGYLDPDPNISDTSAFVYFSNVRVVDLGAFIQAQPVSVIATQGQNVSFIATANLGANPITNTWYQGNTAPTALVQTEFANATNLTSTLTLNNVQSGTNYFAVFSDSAGSVTSVVANLEVILGPTNRTVLAGSLAQVRVTASGQAAPTFQWRKNGVNLANSTHFAGVTTATLNITNVQASDIGTYSVVASNTAGVVIPAALLDVLVPPPSFGQVVVSGGNIVMTFTSTNGFDTSTAFILQSAPVVEGPYTNTTGSFSGSGGNFQVTVPAPNATTFFRLRHIN